MENPSEMTVLAEGFDQPTTNYIHLPSLQSTQADQDSLNNSGSSLSSAAKNSIPSHKSTSRDTLTSLPSSTLQAAASLCTPKRHKYVSKSPVASRLPKCSCTSCWAQNILAMQSNAVFPSDSYRPFRTALCEKSKPQRAVKFDKVQLLTYDKKSGCVYEDKKIDIDFGDVTNKTREGKVAGVGRGTENVMGIIGMWMTSMLSLFS